MLGNVWVLDIFCEIQICWCIRFRPSFLSSATTLICVCVWMLNRLWLFVTLWTVTHQAPLSMGFFWVKILKWVAFFFSRGSSWSKNRNYDSWITGRFIICLAPGGSDAYPLSWALQLYMKLTNVLLVHSIIHAFIQHCWVFTLCHTL